MESRIEKDSQTKCSDTGFSLKIYEDPEAFVAESAELLLQNESINNLILGLQNRALKDPVVSKPLWQLSFFDGNQWVGSAIQTDPSRALVFSNLDPCFAPQILAELRSAKVEPTEWVGPRDLMDALKNSSSDRFQFETVMDQGVYECREVIGEVLGPQSLYTATKEDLNTFVEFFRNFVVESGISPRLSESELREQGSTLGTRLIKEQKLFFLLGKSGEKLSMAGSSRQSRNAACISYVYTPPALRGQGFGTTVTGKVTQVFLDQGYRLCNLYTDLTNPTSNSIYQNIGYKFLTTSQHLRLR